MLKTLTTMTVIAEGNLLAFASRNISRKSLKFVVVVIQTDWSYEESSDAEEVCACRAYTETDTAKSDDELPSKDVDLSCYSISGELSTNGNSSTTTPTSRNYQNRKRKYTENRSPIDGLDQMCV